MAKVIILTTQPNNAPAINFKKLIESLGYQVVMYTTSVTVAQVISQGKPGKDVAMIFSLEGISSNILVQLSGLGYIYGGGLEKATTYDLKIYYSSTVNTNSIASATIVNSTKIFSADTMENITIPLTGSQYSLNSNGFMLGVKTLITAINSTVYLAFMHPGNATFNSNFYIKNPIFFIGFLSNFSAAHVTDQITKFFRDIIHYAILKTEPPYLIQGTVKDFQDNPLERNISVYNQVDFTLKNSGKSSPDTGEYSIGVYNTDSVFVVYHPESTEKPDIHYNILPVDNPLYIS